MDKEKESLEVFSQKYSPCVNVLYKVQNNFAEVYRLFVK